MNWLDIVLLLILAISILSSFRKGFTREVVGLVTVVLALLLGTWFYGPAGSFLEPYVSSRVWANFAGFFLVFFTVLVLGGIVNLVIGRFLKVTGLSVFDHVLGAGFGVLRGMVIAVALIMAIMAFTPADRPPESVMRSRLAPYVADAARVAAAVAPRELKEGFRRTYGEAKDAWSKAWNKGARPAPGSEKGRHATEI